MKFFSRMMMVVALLAFLAYGSFAFGKYVLSAKLFGDDANSSSLRTVSRSTTEASAVTRQTGWKGTKPRVEVKVLPSSQAGGGANLPTFADEDGFRKSRSDDKDDSPRRTIRAAKPAPTPATRLGKREFDNASARDREDDDSRRSTRRRRKARPKKNDDDSKPARSESDSASSSASPVPVSSNNSSGDSAVSRVTTASSSPSRERSSSNSSDTGSSRESTRSESTRNESSRSEGARSESSRNRESSRPRRERSRRETSSSPIPRPEGLTSSGGDSASISPVPRPE